jgi:hypothetical protein
VLTNPFREWLTTFERTQAATGDEQTLALLAHSDRITHRGDTRRHGRLLAARNITCLLCVCSPPT